jgi:hypothetical protein
VYSGSSVVPASSCRRSVFSASGGRSARSRFASATKSGKEARGVREDERAQPGRVRERVLLAEEAAPRLAEDVVAVGDSERVDEVVELANEELDRPEVGAPVRIVRAAAVPELVVVDDRAAVGQVGDRQEIVVGGPGPAVQDDERRRRRGVPGPQLAGHAEPRLRLPEGDCALAHLHLRDSTPVVHTFHRFHNRLRPLRRRWRVARHWYRRHPPGAGSGHFRRPRRTRAATASAPCIRCGFRSPRTGTSDSGEH